MRALLIAEKPSLMKKIQEVYREHKSEIPMQIDFLAQAGHLIGLKLPSEINPEKYKKWRLENFPLDIDYEYKIIKRDLYNKIRDAIKSGKYDLIIHAGDADSEGELLVNIVLEHIGTTLPIKRFWESATTPGAILKALKNMKDDSEYENIYKAALIRQHIDYQFGMNLTTVSSLKLGDIYKIGRVKAGIIRSVYDRDKAIKNFVEKSTWRRSFVYNDCEFLNGDVYESEEEARVNLPNIDYSTVISVKEEIKNHKAPKLYKLATLQTDAYKCLGYSASQSLEVLQHLYEAGIVTYPRSDCEYISSDEALETILPNVAKILNIDYQNLMANIPNVKKDSTYVNDKAISTEGHTAVIPTGEGNLNSVGPRERALFELIARRFLAIFADPKQVKTITVAAIPGDNNELGEYIYKDSYDIEAGFELILNEKYQKKQGKNVSFVRGQVLRPVKFQTKESVSKPPAKFNEGSLIRFLDKIEFRDDNDNKIIYSIGTPATRANIIKECIECGYLVVEKGIFSVTAKAEHLINTLGDISLFDIQTSGYWESLLERVRKGEINANTVEEELLSECHKITHDIKNRTFEAASFVKGAGNAVILGKCPKCGAEIHVGKFGAYCSGKCGMQVAKAMGKMLTNNQIKSLLEGKRTLIKGITSQSGKKYDAYLTPTGIAPFSYKTNDGSTKTMYGFQFDIKYAK